MRRWWTGGPEPRPGCCPRRPRCCSSFCARWRRTTVRPGHRGQLADLWQRLGRPGDPPDLNTALGPLVAHGLLAAEAGPDQPAMYRLHPEVAAAGRAAAGPDFQAAVDTELAAWWHTVFRHAVEQEGQGLGWLVLRAGRARRPLPAAPATRGRRRRHARPRAVPRQVAGHGRGAAAFAAPHRRSQPRQSTNSTTPAPWPGHWRSSGRPKPRPNYTTLSRAPSHVGISASLPLLRVT